MADEDRPTSLDREQIIARIGRHASQLAGLAREQGCTTLSHMLQDAAEQAEKDLSKPRGKGEGSVS
jgi:hypothetical protein